VLRNLSYAFVGPATVEPLHRLRELPVQTDLPRRARLSFSYQDYHRERVAADLLEQKVFDSAAELLRAELYEAHSGESPDDANLEEKVFFGFDQAALAGFAPRRQAEAQQGVVEDPGRNVTSVHRFESSRSKVVARGNCCRSSVVLPTLRGPHNRLNPLPRR